MSTFDISDYLLESKIRGHEALSRSSWTWDPEIKSQYQGEVATLSQSKIIRSFNNSPDFMVTEGETLMIVSGSDIQNAEPIKLNTTEGISPNNEPIQGIDLSFDDAISVITQRSRCLIVDNETKEAQRQIVVNADVSKFMPCSSQIFASASKESVSISDLRVRDETSLKFGTTPILEVSKKKNGNKASDLSWAVHNGSSSVVVASKNSSFLQIFDIRFSGNSKTHSRSVSSCKLQAALKVAPGVEKVVCNENLIYALNHRNTISVFDAITKKCFYEHDLLKLDKKGAFALPVSRHTGELAIFFFMESEANDLVSFQLPLFAGLSADLSSKSDTVRRYSLLKNANVTAADYNNKSGTLLVGSEQSFASILTLFKVNL